MKASLCICLFFAFSCTHTYHYTYTQKSGIEQLLVAKAIDEAVKAVALDIKEAKLFIEVACLMRDEEPYIRKALTHRFLEAGNSVMENQSDWRRICSTTVRVIKTNEEVTIARHTCEVLRRGKTSNETPDTI